VKQKVTQMTQAIQWEQEHQEKTLLKDKPMPIHIFNESIEATVTGGYEKTLL